MTQKKEDHLTEFFAAVLTSSPQLSRNFIQFIFGSDDTRDIRKIETQVNYDDCRPDMRLTLSDGSIILCENKLDANETIGNANTEGMLQLQRYLKLPVDGLIYIRTELKCPSSEVLNNPKYIKPLSAPHFLWRDFYPIIAADSNPLARCVAEGFETMGFVPPNPYIGDLDRNAPRTQRENFSKFWFPTSVKARELGWKVQIGDIVERYLYNSAAELAHEISIHPIDPTRFLVRYTPIPNKEKVLLDKLQSVNHRFEQNIVMKQVKRTAGLTTVIDIETPINNVISSTLSTSHEIEQALMNYVLPYIQLAMSTQDRS